MQIRRARRGPAPLPDRRGLRRLRLLRYPTRVSDQPARLRPRRILLPRLPPRRRTAHTDHLGARQLPDPRLLAVLKSRRGFTRGGAFLIYSGSNRGRFPRRFSDERHPPPSPAARKRILWPYRASVKCQGYWLGRLFGSDRLPSTAPPGVLDSLQARTRAWLAAHPAPPRPGEETIDDETRDLLEGLGYL